MNANLHPMIRKLATVRFEHIEVTCEITAIKQARGRTTVQVEPLHGLGKQWVSIKRVLAIENATTPGPICTSAGIVGKTALPRHIQ